MEFINRIRVELVDEHKAFHVFSTSLGREGMFLRSNDPLPLGKKVSLEFDTPQGTVRVDEGEVSWVKPPEPINTDGVPAGMDIAFCRMTSAARALIDALVDPVLGRSPEAAATSAKSEIPPAPKHDPQGSPLDQGPGPSEFADLFLQKPEVASMNAKEQLQTSTPADLIPRADSNFLLSSPPPAERRLLLLAGYVVIVAAVTFLAMYVFQPRQRTLPPPAPEDQGPPADFGQAGRAVAGAPQGGMPLASAPAPEAAQAPAPATAAALPSAPGQEANPDTAPQKAAPPEEPLKVANITAEPTREARKEKPASDDEPETSPGADIEEEADATAELPEFRETGSGWEMTLRFDRPVKIKHFSLSAPPRLVIDVFGASLSGKKTLTLSSPTPFISQVRVGKAEDHVRFVLDFEGAKIPAHETNIQSNSLQVTFTP